jgi:zinc transport system ATP-binding protein
MEAKEVLLSVKHLDVGFGQNVVLRDLTFDVGRDDVVVVLGLNGAGKTTLLKTILGLLKPLAGSIDTKAKATGYVPQKLFYDRTIPVTVEELLWAYSGASAEEIIEKLAVVSAVNLLKKPVGSLSGGELQRVLIANALLRDPELLLLDEPTSGIDVLGEERFYELISGLKKTFNMAIILVSHDIHTVYKYATKVICLHKGICYIGGPHQMAADKQVQELFGDNLTLYHHEHH